jgi:hypothetical protein
MSRWHDCRRIRFLQVTGAMLPTISFWLNAFIPRDVLGYTVVVPRGAHAGKTAIPLPSIARLWPGNTFKDFSAGYLSDQRGFNNVVGASSRMHSWAQVDLGSMRLIHQLHRSSGTTEVNLRTGEQTGFAVADTSNCRFQQTVQPQQTEQPKPSSPGGVGAFLGARSHGGSTLPTFRPAPTPSPPRLGIVTLAAAAGDPLVGLAADIDYEGTFTIAVDATTAVVSVTFEGLIDAFPAYDCYARYNGVTKAIFTNSPPPGNTVANLLGGADRVVSGAAVFP